MTKEEILNMKPGRELDALIATKIFGWYFKKMPTGKMLLPPDNDERKYFAAVWDENGIPGYLPEYSTDISAAWEVVEKLNEKFEVSILLDINGFANIYLFLPQNLFYDAEFEVENYTSLPEAVCKVALMAVIG